MKPLTFNLAGLFRTSSTRAVQRATIVLAVTIVYGVVYLPLHYFWGEGVSLLSVIPAALTGWFFGTSAGILSSLGLLFFNEILWSLTGESNLSWQFTAWSIVNLVCWGLAGFVTGRASELRYKNPAPTPVNTGLSTGRRGWIVDTPGNYETEVAGVAAFVPGAVLAIDRQGKVVAWNPSMETLTGLAPQEILGRDCSEVAQRIFKDGRHLLAEFALGRPINLQKEFPGARQEKQDVVLETFFPDFKPGGAYLIQKSRPLFNLDGIQVGAIQFLQDVTDLRLAQERQTIREQRDPVTGLGTQDYFEKQVDWLENSRSFPNSILLVRLKVNAETAKAGHTKEEELLKRAAAAIQTVFRATDTVTYLGGHDFAILAPKADVGSAQRLAERLRKSLTLRSLGKFEPVLHFSVVAVTSLEAGTLMETFEQGRQLLSEE